MVGKDIAPTGQARRLRQQVRETIACLLLLLLLSLFAFAQDQLRAHGVKP